MRTIVAVALLVFFAISCITEKTGRTPVYRIIKNTTDYEVELNIITIESNSYNLAKGDSIVFEGYCETGFGDFCFVPWDENNPISGNILFDNDKILIFENDNCETGRSPLGEIMLAAFNCGYKVRTNEGRLEYIYYIDDSDYERAVPIED